MSNLVILYSNYTKWFLINTANDLLLRNTFFSFDFTCLFIDLFIYFWCAIVLLLLVFYI